MIPVRENSEVVIIYPDLWLVDILSSMVDININYDWLILWLVL